MSDLITDPVLQAVVEAAVGASGAAEGWLVGAEHDHLVVRAAFGVLAGGAIGGTVRGSGSTAAFVVASGQPVALTLKPDDPRLAEGVPAMVGIRPTTVLCVPCSTDHGVGGALELVDKQGGVAFNFDDVEVATLLAGIGGVCLAAGSQATVPAPIELARELDRLAAADPTRYAVVANMVAAVLAGG